MIRLAAAVLGAALVATAVPQAALADQQEDQIGQQVYQQLAQKGEIVQSSPYYAILAPIAQQIKRVADPQYDRPFNFIIVHEAQPNAFAVPGGNVYVTDKMFTFVKNREELAGVLCHETSHTIHHDVVHLMAKEQKLATNLTIGQIAAGILFGQRGADIAGTAANIDFQFSSLHFSRDVEAAADAKGAQTCAQAGSNPWGMVWLFQQFEAADTGNNMEMLSDHPSDQHRIDQLQAEFRADPALFGRYSSDIASATPLGQNPRSTAAVQPLFHRHKKTTAYQARKPFGPGSGYHY